MKPQDRNTPTTRSQVELEPVRPMSSKKPSRQTLKNQEMRAQGLCIKCKQPNEDPERLQCPTCRDQAKAARKAEKIMRGEPMKSAGRPPKSATVFDAIQRAYIKGLIIQLTPERVTELMEDPVVGPAIASRTTANRG